MARILTFLGKGGSGRTTVAVSAAKALAAQGQKVLLVGHGGGPTLGLLLGQPLTTDPQVVGENLQAVQLQMTVLLERSWEEVKQLEAQYVRTPFFKEVYGQELGVLPGMDSALALNAIRQFEASGSYDVIIYDGAGDESTLRMFGMAEVLSWYIRRFRQVFADSDLGKTISPFIQPLSAAVLNNVNWAGDNFAQPVGQVNNVLDQGKEALADPQRVAAYLVTTDDAIAIAQAQYLWGSAQQIGLTVGGVILTQGAAATSEITDTYAPLSITTLPARSGDDWQPLIAALPDFSQVTQAPRPITVDVAQRQVSLYLPGFDKTQVKLTQYGPEITVEAGDQRRNIFLPPELRGRSVTGAKFQNGYLIISL